jgi:hypothetical protein
MKFSQLMSCVSQYGDSVQRFGNSISITRGWSFGETVHIVTGEYLRRSMPVCSNSNLLFLAFHEYKLEIATEIIKAV